MSDDRRLAKTLFDASLDLARSRYLTRLGGVYDFLTVPTRRHSDPPALQEARRLYESGRYAEWVLHLCNTTWFPRFPVEHPLATMLRKDPSIAKRDPGVVDMLLRYLRDAGVTPDDVEAVALLPGKINQHMNGFATWMNGGLRLIDGDGVVTSLPVLTDYAPVVPGPYVVGGGDKFLAKVARTQFSISRPGDKGVDLVARAASGQPVVGEAKLLTDIGGNQDKSLAELVAFLREGGSGDRATRIAIVDGQFWLYFVGGSTKRWARAEGLRQNVQQGKLVLSALLVPELLQSL